MTDIKIATLSGGHEVLRAGDVSALAGRLRGELLAAGSPGYDESRTIWNAMIDRRPALVARCAGVADVMATVRFARERGLVLSVRGAGHNIAGSAVCDGGLLIDLSAWRAVRVDPSRKVAWVQPGARLGDVDHETQAFELATPMGVNSTTGIAGLTLGGGFGWLSRKHGLTIDNLRAADVVTADGNLVRASERDDADLFWAIRGGGGNFGVVTSFELGLHRVGPEVLSGLIVHPLQDAGDVLRRYRRFVEDMSDELCIWTVVRRAPPLPFLPAQWHGKEVLILAACYAGPVEDGLRQLEPLRRFGEPIADVISPHPYAGWQTAFDPLLTPGARNYWKSHNLKTLSDGLIDVLCDFAGRLPSDDTEIFLALVGGAINRVAVDATAYPHRDAELVMNVHARWTDAKDDRRCSTWARQLFEVTEPFATGGVYVNFIPEDEDRVASAYGSNYPRLRQLKRRYDPENLFRANQNIV